MSAQNLSTEPPSNAQEPRDTTIFRIPVGKLGFIGCLLIGGASGFIVFFITFFLAIIGVCIYDSATGTSMLNLNISYLYIAAPVGIVAMVVNLTYLLSLWARRKFAGGH